MTQDIQAELRMIREIQSWLRNEERFREEILGASADGLGHSVGNYILDSRNSLG
jgi:hypothetical protein